jgi:Cu/Ag efflux pump CusA
VQINAQTMGYSPLETEPRVTFLVETAMAGLPRLAHWYRLDIASTFAMSDGEAGVSQDPRTLEI